MAAENLPVIDLEATAVGDLHRAAFALKEENRMLRELLREARDRMAHARAYIQVSDRMHTDAVWMYDDALKKLTDAL